MKFMKELGVLDNPKGNFLYSYETVDVLFSKLLRDGVKDQNAILRSIPTNNQNYNKKVIKKN